MPNRGAAFQGGMPAFVPASPEESPQSGYLPGSGHVRARSITARDP